jgi:hypothetical protein
LTVNEAEVTTRTGPEAEDERMVDVSVVPDVVMPVPELEATELPETVEADSVPLVTVPVEVETELVVRREVARVVLELWPVVIDEGTPDGKVVAT